MTGSGKFFGKSAIKRALFFGLAVLFITLLSGLPVTAAETGYGDINADGQVNVSDVTYVMRHSLGLEELDAKQMEQADVNLSGSVNVQDVVYVMQHALGMIDSFPADEMQSAAVIKVEPNINAILGSGFTPLAEVKVSFNGQLIRVNADSAGSFELYEWDYDQLDLERGDAVRAESGNDIKVHYIRDLQIDQVALGPDTVIGRAEPGTVIKVLVHDLSREYKDFPARDAAVGTDGRFRADFSFASGTGLSKSAYNLVEESVGEALWKDKEGDATLIYWDGGQPAIEAYPVDNTLIGYNWAANLSITVTIDGTSYETDSDGHGYFYLLQVPVSRGDLITVTDGINSRSHVVTVLSFSSADRQTGLIQGTAAPGSSVILELLEPIAGRPGPPDVVGKMNVIAAGDGSWSANFNRVIADNIYIYIAQEDQAGGRTVIIK